MTSKIELGKFQELIVVKQTDFGVFLNTPTGAEQDKILLPKAHVPQGTQLKDVLNVRQTNCNNLRAGYYLRRCCKTLCKRSNSDRCFFGMGTE